MTLKDFQSISFSCNGYPSYARKLIWFLARIDIHQNESKSQIDASEIKQNERELEEEYFNELLKIGVLQQACPSINFSIYQSFFRTFCKDQGSNQKQKQIITADYQSLAAGIQKWYGGKANPTLSFIIYNYLGKGKINHKITFPEFFEFITDFLKPVKKNHNYIIFNLITNG